MPHLAQIVVWIVVGLIGGTLAGMLVTRERHGYGVWRNLLLGMAGAVVGGFLFWLFGLWPGLQLVSISLRDIVAALAGTLIVLAVLGIWRRVQA